MLRNLKVDKGPYARPLSSPPFSSYVALSPKVRHAASAIPAITSGSRFTVRSPLRSQIGPGKSGKKCILPQSSSSDLCLCSRTFAAIRKLYGRTVTHSYADGQRGLLICVIRKNLGFFTPFPLVRYINQLILFLSSAFRGPPSPHPLRTSYMEAPLPHVGSDWDCRSYQHCRNAIFHFLYFPI